MEKPPINENDFVVDEIKSSVIEILGEASDQKEIELAMMITDIVYDTRVEKYNVVKATSVTNETVKDKAERLFSIPRLEDKIIPEFLKSEYPVQFDEETKKKAPWVNMIHAWNKVLNELNTVYAMQKEQTIIDPYVIASIAHVLYNFTTNADGDRFIRSDRQFLNREKYVETIKRESGTQGANSQRHVCFEEMKYILNVIHKEYSWGE